MSILDDIMAFKKKEVQQSKELFPIKLLEQSLYFEGTPVSLKKYLKRPDQAGIIAEFKRKSPSKGVINKHAKVESTSIGYMQAGASGLSILTDQKFFGGKAEDLKTARQFNFCPILRKDFIVDEYQVVEAKSMGADVILLIAACLDTSEIQHLSTLAKSLGMEVLLEVHNPSEIQRSLGPNIDIVGVNNRNLKSFETSIDVSKKLAPLIPHDFIKISESGIDNVAAIAELRQYGYQGFLLGEFFMKQGQPAKACRNFIKELKGLKEDLVKV